MKFLPSRPVLSEDVAATSSGFHFARGDKEALRSPLAKKLLSIEHVSSVFVGKDFVTVSKTNDGAWTVIKPFVFSHIMDWYSEGTSAVEDDRPSDTTILDDDSEVVALIKELIEARIRPAVQEDGGDIFFRGYDEQTGVVSVELAGSCVGCPSSSVTLRNGVENMLMHYIPEVKGIDNVTRDDDDDVFKLTFPTNDDDPPQPLKDDPRVSL
ncbi:hypothetical protein CTAYLR_007453 [Chrysophaeum taylorii]|uniref:Scaffold protein Nfu/NifU N-terminal domain-containing protein n=1 Tax=Chrysophaeum taylorii TaxID=2483200 RepID=A0AAD7UC39_9STRA|nr:hypothetical protein CTAYLR_007453 [Chrysophaeum taylorii]